MGLLRLILALSVVAGHSKSTVFGFYGVGATYAVPVFFAISGFYMAMILNEKYVTNKVGEFYLSRAMRIFPMFFVGVALSLLVSHKEIYETFKSLEIIPKLYMLISNFFIFGGDLSNQFCWVTTSGTCERPLNVLINPPSWSLSPELLFYAIAPFAVRNTNRIILMILVGCLYFFLANKIHYPLQTFPFNAEKSTPFVYYFWGASIVFFFLGALGYKLKNGDSVNYIYLLIVALVVSCTETTIPSWLMLLLCVGIPQIFSITKNNSFDRVMGELSYPIYILHYPVCLLLFRHEAGNGFISTGSLAAIITILISLPAYFLIDKRLSKVRHMKVKPENNSDKANGRHWILPLLIYSLIPILTVSIAGNL